MSTFFIPMVDNVFCNKCGVPRIHSVDPKKVLMGFERMKRYLIAETATFVEAVPTEAPLAVGIGVVFLIVLAALYASIPLVDIITLTADLASSRRNKELADSLAGTTSPMGSTVRVDGTF